MTGRRGEREWKESTEEADKHRQEEHDRRSDELRESWRRNHPTEDEEERKRPKRDRPA
jgi:hypothetical protein